MISVNRNEGIINTGDNSTNQVTKQEYHKTDDINWETLNKEINILKSNPDSSIKKFAHEVGEAAEKKDKQGIFKVLSKWIPCIADLISSSYYIIEVAKNFKIGQQIDFTNQKTCNESLPCKMCVLREHKVTKTNSLRGALPI